MQRSIAKLNAFKSDDVDGDDDVGAVNVDGVGDAQDARHATGSVQTGCGLGADCV